MLTPTATVPSFPNSSWFLSSDCICLAHTPVQASGWNERSTFFPFASARWNGFPSWSSSVKSGAFSPFLMIFAMVSSPAP